MSPEAFQDRIPDNRCFGCGPNNAEGLRIKSYWNGPDRSICTYRPEAYQSAGPEHFLNGGIIATLIDCHSVCTAVAWFYRSENREIGSRPKIWCVTGEISVRYLAPTPIDHEVDLVARVVEAEERRVRLGCSLSSSGKIRVEGDVVAIRVPSDWTDRQGPMGPRLHR